MLGAVWMGDEMIVLGGVVRAGNIEAVGDRAAFDPSDGSWRSIRSSPPGVLGGGGHAAVWTGRRALFSAGNSPDGPVGGAAYDPRTGRWRKLSRGPLGPREGYASSWTGTELVIVGGRRSSETDTLRPAGRDALQIYSLASDTWEIVQAGRSPLNSREGSVTGGKCDRLDGLGSDRLERVAPRTGNPTPNGGKRITLIA